MYGRFNLRNFFFLGNLWKFDVEYSINHKISQLKSNWLQPVIDFMIDWPIFHILSQWHRRNFDKGWTIFFHILQAIEHFDKFDIIECLGNCVKLGNFVAQLIRISGYYHLVAIIVHYFIVCSMYSNDRDDVSCIIMNALCVNLSNQINVHAHISPSWTKIQQ